MFSDNSRRATTTIDSESGMVGGLKNYKLITGTYHCY